MADKLLDDEPKVIPHEAIAYIKSKKLATSYNWSEIYAQQHASKFTVAKIMEMDVLDDIHQSVIEAVAEGQSFYTFKKGILNRLGESGWGNFEQADEVTGEKITRLSNRRLRKVYSVNKTQSYHTGSWHRFETNKATHPYLRYRLGPSKEHRLEHKGFESLVLHVDDPFWQTHMPMNGWGCKCWVQSLTAEKAEKMGISKSPEVELHDWVNKSTGRIHKVPKGIDPGFEYNVGKHHEHKALEMVTDKLSQVVTQNPGLANATMTALLNDTAQKAMIAKVVHDMVTDIAENKRAYGNTLAVGTIKDEVVDKLEQLGKAPYHRIIAVRDVDILHGLRDSKQKLDKHLDIEFWQNLPIELQNPTAILLQSKEQQRQKNALDTLVFVYAQQNGKLLVKVDYAVKTKDTNGEKKQILLNLVKTGSALSKDELSTLRAFELLWGEL
ncbi:phage minor head protein [Psychrobacter sp. FDAARGOS_221]|uniref:phage head morphogenesis protein n=1 Tax=Psychrobacter sp. FDAARGOS_221 TaxID=1975705 RepID=UPI000BB54A2D|nr:phage minor head protein [Psychrobacter sp. FDAARGOS_221]PNK59457.1 hypothetical protein A6J60_000180 [Psychrobacter sp. FDAARGOS_221]PNK59927.1 hypothetical protein A6J60_002880 [Psychrobacter sp. FDAARGOS_221]PNK61474.1 hypothetical protein A6J60_011765 [Psychrobacter sp. FDAARGOS_221]